MGTRRGSASDAADERAVAVVRERLSWVEGAKPSGRTGHPPWAHVADAVAAATGQTLSGRNAGKLYDRAFDRGLVELEVVDRRADPPEPVAGRDDDLSQALEDAVRALHPRRGRDFKAHVLTLTGPATSDAALHAALGTYAGGHVLAPDVMERDRIAVTGGRAVVAAIDALIDQRGLGGTALYALTGCSERGSGVVAGSSLDADSVVRRAVSTAEGDAAPRQVRYMTLPLAVPATVMKGSQIRDEIGHYLDPSWWKRKAPITVVMGAAIVHRSVASGHPLFVSRNPFIGETLAKLVELLDATAHDELVVGEVAHRLWVAHADDEEIGARAERLCKKINVNMVAPTFATLALGRRRLLVAGSSAKVPVVESLLRGGTDPFRPSDLVVDADAGAELIELLRARP